MIDGLALHVLEQIQAAGVRTVCVCPGARNAEWVELLASNPLGFEVFWFYEERSAAFFALGRMRASGHPAAVVTTSGTAAGELLPAAMEAYYSGQPLFLLTADRPRRFRGSGAPQAAEQAGLFGIYAPVAYDLEADLRITAPIFPALKPIHLNVCFEDPNATQIPRRRDEPKGSGGPLSAAPPSSEAAGEPPPLAPGDLSPRRVTGSGGGVGVEVPESLGATFDGTVLPQRPLVIVGAVDSPDRPAIEQFLERLGAPVFLESLSGLRPSTALDKIKIKVGDRLLNRANEAAYKPDGVIRIGGVPTHRFWRDLEDLDLPVLSFSPLEFSGLGRQSTHVQGDLKEFLEKIETAKICSEGAERLLEEDQAAYACLKRVLASEPDSEPALMRTLSESLPEASTVYLGNSLPIREWDLASDWSDKGFEIFASRGLNGIDGQLSTFLGLCQPGRSNWAILGDLTTLYDLSGPWPLRQMPPDIDANLVVFNNSGGKIFDRMFGTDRFQNTHELSFEHWAAMWDLPYKLITSAEEFRTTAQAGKGGLRVIEVRPSAESTKRFWAKYQEALV